MTLKRVPLLDQPESLAAGARVAEADIRGRYGYGRPAHGSAKGASYGFGEPLPRPAPKARLIPKDVSAW